MEETRSTVTCAIIVLIWIIAAILAVIFLCVSEKPFKIGSISDKNSESGIAQTTMQNKLPYGGSRVFILYSSKHLRADDKIFSDEVKKSLKDFKNFKLKNRVISPYENPGQISEDHHAAYAVVSFDASPDDVANAMIALQESLGKPKHIKMHVGGEPAYVSDVNHLSQSNLIRGELVALPLSIIALIFIFRGFITALLPMISGIISISIIVALLYLLGQHFELSIFVLNIASMLGLGLTLDYTLLITYRFREELARGNHACGKAITVTMATAGKAVFFSGLTVLISMSFLLLFPINVLYSIGVGGIVVVVVSVLSALTFLPALLCLLSQYIDNWTVPLWQSSIELEKEHKGLWFRTVMAITKHPLLVFIPTILFLLLLGLPILNVKLTGSDANILPTWAESRQLYDEFVSYYSENELAPIDILFKSKSSTILKPKPIGELYDYSKRLKKNELVKHVSSIVSDTSLTKQQYQAMYTSQKPLDPYHQMLLNTTTKGKYTLMSVISKYPENDTNTFELVHDIRKDKIDSGLTKQVTGPSATIMDTIKGAYLLFYKTIIAISIITYVVLLVLLRSIILPLKAILMNFLSLCVCFGMLVFIFQEGHFSHFLHFKSQGYTDLNLPILLFFGLFGLSMDYEVFLLARIKEFYEKTKDNSLSVALGLERSGLIITSAALIVVIVSGAFVTADIIFIKAFGLGTALAVAIDATVIRILLVPSTMSLMGDWNWYLPKWLDRILPNIKFDTD